MHTPIANACHRLILTRAFRQKVLLVLGMNEAWWARDVSVALSVDDGSRCRELAIYVGSQ